MDQYDAMVTHLIALIDALLGKLGLALCLLAQAPGCFKHLAAVLRLLVLQPQTSDTTMHHSMIDRDLLLHALDALNELPLLLLHVHNVLAADVRG